MKVYLVFEVVSEPTGKEMFVGAYSDRQIAEERQKKLRGRSRIQEEEVIGEPDKYPRNSELNNAVFVCGKVGSDRFGQKCTASGFAHWSEGLNGQETVTIEYEDGEIYYRKAHRFLMEHRIQKEE